MIFFLDFTAVFEVWSLFYFPSFIIIIIIFIPTAMTQALANCKLTNPRRTTQLHSFQETRISLAVCLMTSPSLGRLATTPLLFEFSCITMSAMMSQLPWQPYARLIVTLALFSICPWAIDISRGSWIKTRLHVDTQDNYILSRGNVK